ncbi:hypothetical protein SFUMM280S_09922 [Streptomyces fumanus]
MNIRTLSDQRVTTSFWHASPATTMVRSAGRVLPSGRAAATAGGKASRLTRCAAMRSTSSGPGSRLSSSVSTRVPPPSRAIDHSQMEASKLDGANWSIRVPGATSKRSIRSKTILVNPRWSTTTPLGRPVEPEV